MRYLTLGAVLWCLMGAAASTATADSQLMAPIQTFIDAFNKGDMATAATTHAAAADLAIIDEVPPYLWQGKEALQSWIAALSSDAEKRGITDQVVTISASIREEMSGDHAYVVVPAVYTFKERGVAMRESAQFVVALRKGEGGWLIHGWSWVGPKPEPVVAAKP